MDAAQDGDVIRVKDEISVRDLGDADLWRRCYLRHGLGLFFVSRFEAGESCCYRKDGMKLDVSFR